MHLFLYICCYKRTIIKKFGRYLAEIVDNSQVGQDLIQLTIQTIKSSQKYFNASTTVQLTKEQQEEKNMLFQILTDIIPTLENLWYVTYLL